MSAAGEFDMVSMPMDPQLEAAFEVSFTKQSWHPGAFLCFPSAKCRALACQPGWARYSHTWWIHCANKSSGCWWPFWSGCHGNSQQMEKDKVWEVIKRRLSLNPYLVSPNLMRFHGSRKNNHSPGLLWGPGSPKLSIRQLQISFQEHWTHPKYKFYEAFTRGNPVNHPGSRCGVLPSGG